METPSNQANAEQQFELLFNRLLAVKVSLLYKGYTITIGHTIDAEKNRLKHNQKATIRISRKRNLCPQI